MAVARSATVASAATGATEGTALGTIADGGRRGSITIRMAPIRATIAALVSISASNLAVTP